MIKKFTITKLIEYGFAVFSLVFICYILIGVIIHSIIKKNFLEMYIVIINLIDINYSYCNFSLII